jgi:hypothetical protein
MRQSLLALLASLAILITSNYLCFAQTDPANSSPMKRTQTAALEKLKKQVEKIGIGRKITVIRLDNREFYGSVSSIEADGFEIDEVDSKQTISFKYTELKKVRKDYGGKNYAVGKRINKNRGLIIASAVLGGLILLLVIGLSDKDF